MKRLRAALLFCLLAASSSAPAFNLPDQKTTIAITSLNLERQKQSKSISYSLPTGGAVEHAIYLSDSLTVNGHFEANIEASTQSVLLLGGGGGVTFYPIGGATTRYEDLYIKTQAEPKLNVYLSIGGGFRTFDFTQIDKKTEEEEKKAGSSTQTSDPTFSQSTGKNQQSGVSYLVMANIGAEIPVGFFLTPGLRAQMFQSLKAANAPDLSGTEFWLSLGFAF